MVLIAADITKIIEDNLRFILAFIPTLIAAYMLGVKYIEQQGAKGEAFKKLERKVDEMEERLKAFIDTNKEEIKDIKSDMRELLKESITFFKGK